MIKECQLMLAQLYDNVKKFAKMHHEIKGGSRDTKSLLSLGNSKGDSNDEVIHLILFKTLSLLSLINIDMGNFSAAKSAI